MALDRSADHGVDQAFLARWSPRAFTAEPIPDDVLMSLFEAARWSPSAFNLQPWRFVYARRDTPDWDRLLPSSSPSTRPGFRPPRPWSS